MGDVVLDVIRNYQGLAFAWSCVIILGAMNYLTQTTGNPLGGVDMTRKLPEEKARVA